MLIQNKIIKKIETYQTIIIHRHLRPDMDAIGSQMGLKLGLIERYPDKNIYAVGDLNEMTYHAQMDDISDDLYRDALVMIVDVAVSSLVSDKRYLLAKEVMIIDHHKNDTDIKNSVFLQDVFATSACQMVAALFKKWQFTLTSEAATYLLGGMITDTGRFMYIDEKTAENTFLMAAYVSKFNPNIKPFYDYLYTETLEKRQAKQLFQTFMLTPNKVAYRFNNQEIIDQSKLDIQSVSRGMVNIMSGIKEVFIWASFTEDSKNNTVLAELRSRGIEIVDIAKAYGGGGHAFACGATLKNFEEAKLMLKDLDERMLKYEKNTK